MTPGWVALLIFGVTLPVDAIIVTVVLRSAWASVSAGFEPRSIAADAVRRDFQSFSFGMYNLGMCIHVAADGEHLHLIPAAALRWFGAKQVSIPWEQIEFTRTRGRRAEVRIRNQRVLGPAWALELAQPK
jgi:hypothetical protein